MKKLVICSLVVVLALTFSAIAFGADKEASAPQTKQVQMGPKMVPGQPPMGPRNAMKSNFNMMLGTVSRIDTTDPANVKVELKDERDGKMHTVEVTPATNVTKMTEISELKVGDSVRVMARKVDDKEIAMGVMFGKLKKMTPPVMPPMGEKPTQKTPPPPAKKK